MAKKKKTPKTSVGGPGVPSGDAGINTKRPDAPTLTPAEWPTWTNRKNKWWDPINCAFVLLGFEPDDEIVDLLEDEFYFEHWKGYVDGTEIEKVVSIEQLLSHLYAAIRHGDLVLKEGEFERDKVCVWYAEDDELPEELREFVESSPDIVSASDEEWITLGAAKDMAMARLADQGDPRARAEIGKALSNASREGREIKSKGKHKTKLLFRPNVKTWIEKEIVKYITRYDEGRTKSTTGNEGIHEHGMPKF